MRIILDTQLVIWVATDDPRLTRAARAQIADSRTRIAFSIISLWEIAIKAARGRPDFRHSATTIRAGAQRAGWEEVPVTSDHALAVADLPDIHGGPFDRLLVAQARIEGMILLTSDRALTQYGDFVRLA